jgi:hypothetical protein
VIRAHAAHNPLGTVMDYLLAGLGYFVFYWVFNFFNVALVRAALRRLQGEPVSISAALAFAARRVKVISGYTLLVATVGVFLRMLEKTGFLAKLAARLLGVTWSVSTTLIVPVLVQEARGPLASVARSATLFKRTWGEQLVSDLQLWTLNLMLMLPVVLVAVPLMWVTDHGQLGLSIFLAGVISIGVLGAALNGIFSSALYTFAAEGVIPSDFDDPSFHDVWTVRGAP